MRLNTLTPFTLLLLMLSLSQFGCGSDMSSGNQLVGQGCFVSKDCAGDLICYDRICVAASGTPTPARDMNTSDLPSSDMGPDTAPPPFDMNPGCELGQSYCENISVVFICTAQPNGGRAFTPFMCADGQGCTDDTCVVAQDECGDRDGDGFIGGIGCPIVDDCNDNDGRVSPNERESCATPYDDNCDGQINENCGECCAQGCSADEFCSTTQCACAPYEGAFCQFQDQPCNVEGQISNGFVCSSFDGQFAPRCFGLCQNGNDDTCPEPNSVCSFDENGMGGVCLSACTLEQGCGSDDLGCLPIGSSSSQGLCLPANPANPVGSSCDVNINFDCVGGALCVPQDGGNSGVCTAACRPFANVNDPNNPSDCTGAAHCLPFSADIGVCSVDNDDLEGDLCSPIGSMCQADAVGCYPSPFGGQRCTRLCRLGVSGDCSAGQRCRQYDMNQNELGYCG